MAVCKYFMQGNCNYGSSCWYEHPSGDSQGYSISVQRQVFGSNRGGGAPKVSFGQNQNPYRWLAPDVQQSQNRNVPSVQQMSADDIVKKLANEVKIAWEDRKMWPFSCIGFEKEMPSVPGLTDISPEEMRYKAYEAQKLGNHQQYLQMVQTAISELNRNRQELKNPNLTFKQKLISFIEDCHRKKTPSAVGAASLLSDSYASGNGFLTCSGSGLFGDTQTDSSAIDLSLLSFSLTQPSLPAAQSTFAQSGSLLGQGTSATTFGQTAVFGQPHSTGQSGLFGQQLPSQTPQQGLFGKSENSLFSGGPLNASATSIPISQNVFDAAGTALTCAMAPSLFHVSGTGQQGVPAQGMLGAFRTGLLSANAQNFSGRPAAQAFGSSSSGQSAIYTLIDKVTATELQHFQAATFTLGSIPTKPPPKELCLMGVTGTGQQGVLAQSMSAAFGTGLPSANAQNVFGRPAAQAFGSSSLRQSAIYTLKDKVTMTELQNFQAANFTLGSIPTKPPPQELCL